MSLKERNNAEVQVESFTSSMALNVLSFQRNLLTSKPKEPKKMFGGITFYDRPSVLALVYIFH